MCKPDGDESDRNLLAAQSLLSACELHALSFFDIGSYRATRGPRSYDTQRIAICLPYLASLRIRPSTDKAVRELKVHDEVYDSVIGYPSSARDAPAAHLPHTSPAPQPSKSDKNQADIRPQPMLLANPGTWLRTPLALAIPLLH